LVRGGDARHPGARDDNVGDSSQPREDSPISPRFQTFKQVSVQLGGASATADPCFRAWIGRQSNRLARNRHVIDEFMPQQRVSLAKHAVSVV
jgi:hypothetical protein